MRTSKLTIRSMQHHDGNVYAKPRHSLKHQSFGLITLKKCQYIHGFVYSSIIHSLDEYII